MTFFRSFPQAHLAGPLDWQPGTLQIPRKTRVQLWLRPGDVRRYRGRGAGVRPAGAPARRLNHRQPSRTRLAGWLPVGAHHTPSRPAQAGGDMRVTRRPLHAWARAPPLPDAAPACPAGRIQAASHRSRSASPVIAAGAAAVRDGTT
jgi:hypothetical protein